MNPDLEQLIKLQALETELQGLKRVIDTEDERRRAIQDALDVRKTALSAIREQLAENQNARRALEKDLAQVQGRLSKYRDQLMAVKTNKEYHAVQTEISVAEAEVQKFEDRILEGMVEGDDITARLKAAEREIAAAETQAKTASQSLTADTTAAHERMAAASAARAEVAGKLPRATLSMFETIASHRGVAVVLVTHDGHCSVCHVRLRPKVFQDIRRNDAIMQCDSCGRIIYFVHPAAPNPQAQSVAN